MATVLTQETKTAIETNSTLYARVCDLMGIKPVSLPMALRRNGMGLTQPNVLEAIAAFTGRTTKELIEEVDEEPAQKVA